MSYNTNKCLVAKIYLETNTYYVSSRPDILLDGITYKDAVLEWGDITYKGNLGNGEFEIGSMSISLANGEAFIDDGYYFDITDVWNDKTCEVRKWSFGDSNFSSTVPIKKGIIKNFSSDNNHISFVIEDSDNRDDIMIPDVLLSDDTELTTAEYRTSFKKWANTNFIQVADYSIFSAGDFIYLVAPTGESEYQKISSIDSSLSRLYLSDNLVNHTYYTTLYNNYVEKAFVNIPIDMVNKTVPITFGDLTDSANGVFAKTVTPNNLIGNQKIVSDTLRLYQMDSIGAWESGTKRYFAAKQYSGSDNTGEYQIGNSKNFVSFLLDTEITLTADIITEVDAIIQIEINDYTKLFWSDEDEIPSWQNTPKLLGANIISIGQEILHIVDKPTSNLIWVERGYGDTEVTTHSAGETVYQSSLFSSKNLLTFSEIFKPTLTANYFYGHILKGPTTPDFWDPAGERFDFSPYPVSGKFYNLIDDNTSTYLSIGLNNDFSYLGFSDSGELHRQAVNFDLKFPDISDDFTVYGAFVGLNWTANISHGTGDCFARIGIYSSSYASNRRDFANGKSRSDIAYIVNAGTYDGAVSGSVILFSNTYSTPNRTLYDASNRLNYDIFTGTSMLSQLTDLNKKFKLTLCGLTTRNLPYQSVAYSISAQFYQLGFWIDFFRDFTKETIVAPVIGRYVHEDAINIIGAGRFNKYAKYPVEILLSILIQELGYAYTDFSSSWSTEFIYTTDASNYESVSPLNNPPLAAFSYGDEDDQMDGFKFCSYFASHYNLQIIKNYDGKVDIVNLHKIYNNTPTANKIEIEDILFISDNRRLYIKQTGNDLIYNKIIVKYSRNNSNGQFQKNYILPTSYTLASGNTLSQAKTTFYNGKDRTLTIESPFIYNEDDARRLAEWKADDQSEIHFFIDLFVDFDHYININGLGSQYKIGDIIYLNGSHSGISFDSTKKFYIQNINIKDHGRELQIQAKSLLPITSF